MERNIPLGLRFSLLHRSFQKQMDARLKEHELTGVQFGVLSQVAHMEDEGIAEINQRDLEKVSRVTHPTMTAIIKRLEKKGFIRCETSASDRRYKCIYSTEKAHSLLCEIKETDHAVFKELCRGLEQTRIDELLCITDHMLKNAFECCRKGMEDDNI